MIEGLKAIDELGDDDSLFEKINHVHKETSIKFEEENKKLIPDTIRTDNKEWGEDWD